jgi:hypothetical protein
MKLTHYSSSMLADMCAAVHCCLRVWCGGVVVWWCGGVVVWWCGVYRRLDC